MKALLAWLAAVVLLAPVAGPAAAKGPDKAVDAAVGKSLDWLDGNLMKLADAGGTPTKQFTFGVAGLVLLLADERGGGGKLAGVKSYLTAYVDDVARRASDVSRLPDRHGQFSSGRLVQYTWPIAQAGIFFAELSTRGRWRGEAKRTLTKVRRILEEAQQADGGWGHGRVQQASSSTEEERPGFRSISGYPATLLASTNCVASALGIIEATQGRGTVAGLDRARAHYRAARNDDGSYPYDRRQRGRRGNYTGASRIGGALLAMHFLGVPHSDPDFAGSLKHLRLRLEYASEGHGSSMLNLAYTALAMKVLGGEDWARFRAEFFPRILARQAEDGSFACICGDKAFATTCDDPRPGVLAVFERTERAYVTSLLTLVLLLDEGRLEVLGKKPVPAPARGETTPRKR